MTNPKLSQGENWHSQSAEEVLAKLGSAPDGLSAAEAAQRLAANGPNELKDGKRISPWQIFFGQFIHLDGQHRQMKSLRTNLHISMPNKPPHLISALFSAVLDEHLTRQEFAVPISLG